MTEQPIKGNGYTKIEINMGNISCMGDPYILDLYGKKIILRYNKSMRDDDYGKLTLESAL